MTTDAVPGTDTLYGGDASDIMFGDHGVISLQTGQIELTNNGTAGLKVETPVNTTGANDTIYGDNGNDVILGGEGADFLLGRREGGKSTTFLSNSTITSSSGRGRL